MPKSLARTQRDAANLEAPPSPSNPALTPPAIERDLRILLDPSGTVTGIEGPDGQDQALQALRAALGNVVTSDVNPLTGGIANLTANGRTARSVGGLILAKKPVAPTLRTKDRSSNERGSAGTYHTTFLGAGDFYGVQPIVNVTRAPTDATYTSDDVYDQVSVAPSATILTGGYPDASGGAGAWVSSANMTFARVAGASPTAPVPVVGSLIYCSSIARSDGGPGRILMARAYSLGSGHGSAATTRMPTYAGEPTSLANCQLWDDATYGFPLSGMGQYYYRSGNYASASQDSFGNGATRWANVGIVGMKFLYAKPTLSVLFCGDSIAGGDYAEAGKPMRASMGFRAVYALQVEGMPIDLINAGVSGYRWDQFGPYMQALVPQVLPDIVVLPMFTPNGTETGVGTGNTQGDADKHWARAMYYRDWLLANGVKDVVFTTPAPQATKSVVIPLLMTRLADSGFPYADINSVLSNGNSYTWKDNYSTDGTHPLAVANAAAATVIKEVLRTYL